VSWIKMMDVILEEKGNKLGKWICNIMISQEVKKKSHRENIKSYKHVQHPPSHHF